MTITFPTDPLVCIPFAIGLGENETGPRIGGTPPLGINPDFVNNFTKYFLTIPIAKNPSLDLSIFLSFDFEQMLQNSNKLHRADNGLLQLVVHEARSREVNSDLCSDLTPRALIFGQPKSDWLVADDGEKIIESSHKIGGRPYFDQMNDDLINQIIKSEDLLQYLQIGFPGFGDAEISGDWPFAGGMFHLFGSKSIEENVWYYLWEV